MEPGKARKIDHLPSLPAILDRLIQTLDNPLSSASDIESILESDQSTTSRLLGVANSAYYGLHNSVTTVSRAVVVLGMPEVRSICLRAALAALLDARRIADPKAAQQIWLHSLAVQEAARNLCRRFPSLRVEEASTAALLHDLGWVVIMGYFPEEWRSIRSYMEEQGLNSAQAEHKVGFGHQQAGGMLASQWDLPPALGEAISSHHNPDPNSSHYHLCQLVHLADFLACTLGAGPFVKPETPVLDPKAAQDLGLSVDQVVNCREELETALAGLAGLWQTLTTG